MAQKPIMKWGTYGVNGDQPLTYVSISDMSTLHILNVMKTQKLSITYMDNFIDELIKRNINTFSPNEWTHNQKQL